MNLRRILTALLAVFIIDLCSVSATANGLYFGVNFALVSGPQREPFIQGFSVSPLPFPGLQIGYDGANSIGVRLSLNYFIFGAIALDGYYRLGIEANGSNTYFGAGADYQFVAFNTITEFYGLHALLGYEWRFQKSWALFIELTPGVLFWSDGLSFAATMRSGVSVRF